MAHTYRETPSAGTTLYVEIGYAYVLIPGATEIAWEGAERGVREFTPLSATSVGKKPGMTNFGELTATLGFDPNDETHQLLRDRLELTAAEQNAALDSFRLEWGGDGFDTPANSEFTGFVSSFSPSASDPETGTVEVELTIQISSTPTHNDGSPAE